MLHICRAEDGELFQIDTTLWEIERSGNLELFLQEETGVPQEAVLAYLSNGSRLTNDNICDLAGAEDETIYVFSKFTLDEDLQEVLSTLRVEPKLHPPIEEEIASTPPFRPAQLAASYLRAARVHYDFITHTVSSISRQHDALTISARSLDLNILDLGDAYDTFDSVARRELERQSELLAALETDLGAISRVTVHTELLSEGVRRSIEAGHPPRTLGDYVSKEKMRHVAEGCTRFHDDLQKRFDSASESMSRLREGSDQVRSVAHSARLIDSAEATQRRAMDAYEGISDLAAKLEKPVPNSTVLLQEFRQMDAGLRAEVETVAKLKNESTEVCISALRLISALNEDLLQLPITMDNLRSEFRARNNFAHIARLHNMIYAYGYTLIEIVRRKEFSRFFYQRAQIILELMAKLSQTERKRRQIYRGEVHGQLPFDLKGMDDGIPSIDFTPSGAKDPEYSLERSDIEAFMQMLVEYERLTPYEPAFVAKVRLQMEKLLIRMDGLESSFDRFVERTLLSASRLSQSRRKFLDADESVIHDLTSQMSKLQNAMSEQESSFANERDRLTAELLRLKSESSNPQGSACNWESDKESLEKQIADLKAQVEANSYSRTTLEDQHSKLLEDVTKSRLRENEALARAAEQAKDAERLRQTLEQVRSEALQVKRVESESSQRITQLLDEQTQALRNLEQARTRGDDLEIQLRSLRSENEKLAVALQDATEQKDQLLRAQALEHDRIIRDHIAEADGDRAVLEQQYHQLHSALEVAERDFKQVRAENEVLQADATGLREELLRTEYELREARHVERVLRNDLSDGRASQSGFEQKINDRDRLVAQILDVAIAFRDSHARASVVLQPLSVHPASANRNGTTADSEYLGTSSSRPQPVADPPPIDPTDPATALEVLRAYDLDAFSDLVSRLSSVVKKWQKQCKEYRERSKGKISFRNFTKGDLALFLPTRNSAAKPWAAFNVSFPHYFLNATGRLAEQLKTREWIVARIISITERIVDQKDPNSNPYSLADGTKYYLLEVEDWTRPGVDTKRRRSSTKSLPDRPNSPPLERPISPPPADSAEIGASAAEPLGPTRSPNSHLFPVRTRANSTSAGPSSLSKLLAQAPTESPLEAIPSSPNTRSRTPSPASRLSQPPASSSYGVPLAHSPSVSSPLRPGSRASRSSSSRVSFSGGRIAPFGRTVTTSGSPVTAKAAPTTALSSEIPTNSPPSSSSRSSTADRAKMNVETDRVSSVRSSTPSPTHSASEGMSNVLLGRRRTTSEHVRPNPVPKRASPSTTSIGTSAATTLVNLVNSWGGSRRRKHAEPSSVNGTIVENEAPSTSRSTGDTARPPSAHGTNPTSLS